MFTPLDKIFLELFTKHNNNLLAAKNNHELIQQELYGFSNIYEIYCGDATTHLPQDNGIYSYSNQTQFIHNDDYRLAFFINAYMKELKFDLKKQFFFEATYVVDTGESFSGQMMVGSYHDLRSFLYTNEAHYYKNYIDPGFNKLTEIIASSDRSRS